MNTKLALIVGAGGVLGEAVADHFSVAGYSVVGLRRRRGETPNPSFRTVECDLQRGAEVQRVVREVIAEFGRIDALIINAAHFTSAPFAESTRADFDDSWQAAVGVAVASVQAALPDMLRRARGVILIGGATGSVRGSARFAAFASAKFALRGLAQSLAREYQPQGIHVAHVLIDGVLRGSASVRRFGVSDEQAIDPHDVARTYLWLAAQAPSAWTHELDLRPATGKF